MVWGGVVLYENPEFGGSRNTVELSEPIEGFSFISLLTAHCYTDAENYPQNIYLPPLAMIPVRYIGTTFQKTIRALAYHGQRTELDTMPVYGSGTTLHAGDSSAYSNVSILFVIGYR